LEVTLNSGFRATINHGGQSLTVISSGGNEAFVLKAPPKGGFYQFVEHAQHGQCPVVSFEPGYGINGWLDWYYRICTDTQSLEQLNPWR
jgi:hypothetical protein